MVPVVAAAAAVVAIVQTADTATFQDDATADLYFRARVRHIRGDSLVRNYSATVRTRWDAAVGRSRFARRTTLLAHETIARISWRRPNDLVVEVLGARTKVPLLRMLSGFGSSAQEDVERDLPHDLLADRPWFIPRALGDSIRLMGIPERAALHPLADGATRYYRYAIRDSVQVFVPGRTVRAVKMRVTPKEHGPSLITGDMWIDAETADVVRIQVLFVGDFLWEQPEGNTPEDSAQALRDSREANRFLTVEADVEYSLIDRQHWMPLRQVLAITGELPWFLNVAVPVRAVTEFSDYRVNDAPPFEFVVQPETDESLRRDRTRRRLRINVGGDSGVTVEDSDEERARWGYEHAGAWRDGWWEVRVPPADTLRAYAWGSELEISLDAAEERRLMETFAELSKLEEEVPPEWIGRRSVQLALGGVADLVRFNRVQGLAVGLGYRLETRWDFTSLLVAGQLGVGDLRPVGSLAIRRDGPAGRLDLSVRRAVREVEPWTGGLGFGNSLNALVTGHDDADYYLALGGGLSYTWNAGPLANLSVEGSVERHDSMVVASRTLWAFPANPPALPGTFAVASLSKSNIVGPLEIDVGADLMTGEPATAGRAWASLLVPFVVAGRTGVITVRGAVVRGDSLPQLTPRLGGRETVRGYAYGVRTAREVWAAQLDWALRRDALLTPVAFFDIGDTFDGNPLLSVGVGLSILNGLGRFDFSKGLEPRERLRFDLHFRAPR